MGLAPPRQKQLVFFSESELEPRPHSLAVKDALKQLADAGTEARGAIFTRKPIVHFILDLLGYTDDLELQTFRVLEPSFGEGDFLLAIVERLLAAWERTEKCPYQLMDCIRAVELHADSFSKTRDALEIRLLSAGIPSADATRLLEAWLIQGDFLLMQWEKDFDFVIGNPPYVRQERIPEPLLAEYRQRYTTIYDRADLYIPFIERSLGLLSDSGHLGFICADRWMKNRYGGPLRQLVADRFHLKIYVDMFESAAFASDVSAYPAITVIARGESGVTRVAKGKGLDDANLSALARALTDKKHKLPHDIREMQTVTCDDQPWILSSSPQLDIVRRLEKDFPTLEQNGCKVGIGVATGADAAFIGPFEELDVEASRKLPLVMTRDIVSGKVQWRGLGVINPFDATGKLVVLSHFPRLSAYLNQRKTVIADRHVAKKSPANWYRTIDRIDPAIVCKPKLLIPDIKGEAHIVYEEGTLYPHHNLYYITSDEWDLRALHVILTSGIARLFVSTYSTKMRGGYLRYQAQYLRRICIPRWQDISISTREELLALYEQDQRQRCNEVVFDLYNLSHAERVALRDDSTGER